jgi:hypothetical protein
MTPSSWISARIFPGLFSEPLQKTGSRIAKIETTPAALGRRDVASIFAKLTTLDLWPHTGQSCALQPGYKKHSIKSRMSLQKQ